MPDLDFELAQALGWEGSSPLRPIARLVRKRSAPEHNWVVRVDLRERRQDVEPTAELLLL